MQIFVIYVLMHKKVNRDAELMGDSIYRFYSSKALQNRSQMFWDHPGRWCSIYRMQVVSLRLVRLPGLSNLHKCSTRASCLGTNRILRRRVARCTIPKGEFAFTNTYRAWFSH